MRTQPDDIFAKFGKEKSTQYLKGNSEIVAVWNGNNNKFTFEMQVKYNEGIVLMADLGFKQNNMEDLYANGGFYVSCALVCFRISFRDAMILSDYQISPIRLLLIKDDVEDFEN